MEGMVRNTGLAARVRKNKAIDNAICHGIRHARECGLTKDGDLSICIQTALKAAGLGFRWLLAGEGK